jgi:predicted permease
LLLIASANVTSLLLAQSQARRRELAIRTALGATPTRLLRLLLWESLQLAIIATLAGALLAKALVAALVSTIPPDLNSARLLPGLDRVTVDLPALAFAALVALAACLAAQIVPAIDLRHIDLVNGLKDAAAVRSPRTRKILVTAEVALSVVLLTSAGLLLKTMNHIREIDLGFRAENILVLRVPLPRGQFNQQYYDSIAAEISALPGVQSAALASKLPLTGDSGERIVAPNYFATMRIPLKRGRFFDSQDHRRIVINEALARRDFPGEDPLGRSIENQEIIGISGDTRSGLFEKEGPIVNRSTSDAEAGQIAIRTSVDPRSLAQAVRKIVAGQGGTVAEVSTMEDFVKNDSWQHEQTTTLTTLFAGLAFLLATVGLYGVISFSAARRRTEIGIRIALGAGRSDVILLILLENIVPVGAGLCVGFLIAIAVSHSLKSLFYEVAPVDPGVLVAAAVAIAIAALAASYLPTLRALKVDPSSTLKGP